MTESSYYIFHKLSTGDIYLKGIHFSFFRLIERSNSPRGSNIWRKKIALTRLILSFMFIDLSSYILNSRVIGYRNSSFNFQFTAFITADDRSIQNIRRCWLFYIHPRYLIRSIRVQTIYHHDLYIVFVNLEIASAAFPPHSNNQLFYFLFRCCNKRCISKPEIWYFYTQYQYFTISILMPLSLYILHIKQRDPETICNYVWDSCENHD